MPGRLPTHPPTSEEQVRFLANIQRLLAEGSFVATYKHALLLALGDTCVETGDDSGAPLTITVDALAEKFITLYWRQVLPWPSETPMVLLQNTGNQAAILNAIAAARRAVGGSLARLRLQGAPWRRLVARVAAVISTMPLWKLQRVGNEVLDFLYPNVGRGRSITLNPGIAFCFRRFHGLVEDVVRGAWVRFVRALPRNRGTLGEVAGLDEFLFGTDRASLAAVRPILADLQSGDCFYCGRALGNAVTEPPVDHFIPWARYPVDLGHNFVLAHATCNGAKGDRLAALPHLDRWAQRNEDHGAQLDAEFERAAVLAHLPTSQRIARWAYEQLDATAGLSWERGDTLVPLDPGWCAVSGLALQ